MLATLLIVFREVIEAGLVIGIVLAATQGVKGRGFWIGSGIGVGVLGACLVAIFEKSILGQFLYGLIGYSESPTGAQLIAYLGTITVNLLLIGLVRKLKL
jgi:high-affinity Fe2+/Pb2+ permease